jgi:hypothetical protein
MNTKAFITCHKKDFYIVKDAKDYQKEALILAIRNNGYYYYDNNGFKFNIKPFNSEQLNDNYSDFYSLIREDKTESIISTNFEKLCAFSNLRNRLVKI